MKPLTFAIALACFAPLAQAATPFDETRAISPDAEISLDNLKGQIEVTTWERNEIRIHGRRGEGTKELAITGDAAHLSIKIEYPENKGWFLWGGDEAEASDLRVTVPAGVSVNVDTVAAQVQVRGVAGRELSIESVSGRVDAQTGAAEVAIETVSGDATIQAQSRELTVESVSGDIRVRGALAERVELEAVSGSIELDSSGSAKHVAAGVVSGDVTLRTGLQSGARLTAESLSGDVEVILPANSSAAIAASSFTGTIKSDQGEVETEEHGPGSSLSLTLGRGDARVDLETFSGDLRLRLE